MPCGFSAGSVDHRSAIFPSRKLLSATSLMSFKFCKRLVPHLSKQKSSMPLPGNELVLNDGLGIGIDDPHFRLHGVRRQKCDSRRDHRQPNRPGAGRGTRAVTFKFSASMMTSCGGLLELTKYRPFFSSRATPWAAPVGTLATSLEASRSTTSSEALPVWQASKRRRVASI